jgi:hypothetical protein
VTDSKPSIPILFFADEIPRGPSLRLAVPDFSELRGRAPDRGRLCQLRREDLDRVPDLRVVDAGQLSHRPRHVFERERIPGRKAILCGAEPLPESPGVRELELVKLRGADARPRGFLFGRATDASGHIEGIHNQVGSRASLLIDEAKTVDESVLDTFDRCTTDFRLFMSSTGNASGGFYQIMTAKSHLWKTFWVRSSDCPHVDSALIQADRENLKDSVFAIKHDARFLYDADDSMISLEHVRAVIDKPPSIVHGKTSAFCDFAGAGDESVLALCQGNDTRIVERWRHRDTMHSVGKFLNWFRKLGLQGWMIGGDEGYGHQLMDRMAEQDFHLHRVNNGS